MAYKYPTITAPVFCEDKGTTIVMTIINSARGYYVLLSKYSGLHPKITPPKQGHTTAWLAGSPNRGFVLPKGILL